MRVVGEMNVVYRPMNARMVCRDAVWESPPLQYESQLAVGNRVSLVPSCSWVHVATHALFTRSSLYIMCISNACWSAEAPTPAASSCVGSSLDANVLQRLCLAISFPVHPPHAMHLHCYKGLAPHAVRTPRPEHLPPLQTFRKRSARLSPLTSPHRTRMRPRSATPAAS